MIDLAEWVDEESDPGRHAFRAAVQLVIRSIALSSTLSPVMIMKGGVLLAIRYGSSRFTRDIDFSTWRRIQDIDLLALIADVEGALLPVSADNEYGLAIRLQSHEVKPSKRPEVSFPTLQMRIAYADRSKPRHFERLRAGASSEVVDIDYSFNEWASDVEKQPVDGGTLSMYPFHDLIAEKLRSVLQQPIRHRERYQDIYDLYLLLESVPTTSGEDKADVLSKLIESTRERNVPLHPLAMRAEDVIELSRRRYDADLQVLVSGPFPDFDTAYGVVRNFFESLPWR